MRTKKEDRGKRVAGGSQREVLRDVMLSAAECGTWMTLRELARLTSYGETSISAQLRHLRKQRYGAFVIDKQVRKCGDDGGAAEHGAVWEYRLRGVWRPQRRRDWFSAPLLRGPAQAAAPLPSEGGGFDNRTGSPSHGPRGSEGERRRVDERQAGAGI
jgi:hypothetical protein